MKICLVTDGGHQMGMGHVLQSITIAKLLAKKAELSFLTKSDESVSNYIREVGFSVSPHPDDAEILGALAECRPDLVLFDKIDVDAGLAEAIKQLGLPLVIFTNLTEANKFADMAVTADIGSEFENIDYIDAVTKTHYYYGPRYWILRPEFHEYRAKAKPVCRRPESVLLIFGGSDPGNLTTAALRELLSMERALKIDVILGAKFGNLADVQELIACHPKRAGYLNVHQNINNVAELMYHADLTLASPGLSAFESLRVGTPIIVIPQDELQRDTYRGFMRVLEKDRIGRLPEMIGKSEFTFPDEDHIARMQIGEGADELVDAILKLPSKVSA